MKGIELARSYYEEYGAAMILERFPEYEERIAVGLVGEGSECFGFDDDFSHDHDFGAGFCLWLGDDDFDLISNPIDEAFASLPSPFKNYPRRELTSGGDKRIGALRISDFYKRFLGIPRVPQTLGEWLAIPEEFLAVCTNGSVFTDPLGAFSEIRSAILAYYPEDIRLKKLAARLGKMGQAGQYNYTRSIKRGECVAALHALNEFVENTESAVYLLNRRYKPFYKWAHRGMRDLPKLTEIYALLTELISREAAAMCVSSNEALIENICGIVAAELKAQNLTDAQDGFLLAHAESVRSRITHDALRKMHIFS